MPSKTKNYWKESRAKELKVEEDPGNWFYFEDPRGITKPGKYSDWYSLSLALEAADLAEKYNIPFTDVMSTFITETLGGKAGAGAINPGHVLIDAHGDSLERLYPNLEPDWLSPGYKRTQEEFDSLRTILMDYSGKLLKDALKKYPNDIIKGLQAYSGEGNQIYGGTKEGRFFGMPASKLGLQNPKNPSYLAHGWDKYFISTFLKNHLDLQGLAAEQRSYNQPKEPQESELRKYLETSGIATELWPLLSDLVEEK
jgi:hypothetical protein